MSASTTFDLPIVGMTCASCAGRVEYQRGQQRALVENLEA